MTTKDTTPTATPKESLTKGSGVMIKCGDCLHFKHSAHPSKPSVCSLIGTKHFANAPSCFTANVQVFRTVSKNTVDQLSALVSVLTGTQSRVLIGLLSQQSKLERRGLRFLESVYICVGKPYLSNYYKAYALNVAPDGNLLLVGNSYLQNQSSSIVFSVAPKSVISAKDFAKIHKTLIESGKVNEPRKPLKLETGSTDEIPTIETSQEMLEKLAKSSGSKKSKKARASSSYDDEGSDCMEVDLSNL